jgi:electron transfer flavoprotein alpha/beta subunit
MLRTMLAMGADCAVRVLHEFRDPDPMLHFLLRAVAKILHAIMLLETARMDMMAVGAGASP